MITTEGGVITVGNLTFLRDSAHPARFYYYSTAPRLAVGADGCPQFGLTLYQCRELDRIGGCLFVGVDLGVSQAALTAARPEVQKLVEVDMAAILEPLPYLHGEVHFFAPLLADPNIWASSSAIVVPLVMGQNQATFSADLTPEGATLLREAIKADYSVMMVTFHLAFFGMRPAPAWQVQADWAQVGGWLAENLARDKGYTLREINDAVSGLVESRIIQLQWVSSWGESVPSELERARSFLAEFLANRYFDFQYGCFTLHVGNHSETDKAIDLHAMGGEHHVYGQASSADLVAATGQSSEEFIHLIELDSSDSTVDVHVWCPQIGTEVEWMEVDLEYGPPGATEKRAVMFRNVEDRPVVRWLRDQYAGYSYRYSYRGRLKSGGLQAKSYDFAAGPFEANEHELVIPLGHPGA